MHTLRFSFLVLIAAVFASSTKAQDNPAVSAHHPNIFLEFGGNGGILSLNYDRRFSEGNNGFGARVGAGLAAVPAGHDGFGFTVSVPLAVNYLLGKGPHQLEAGAGITISGDKFSPSGEPEPLCEHAEAVQGILGHPDAPLGIDHELSCAATVREQAYG